MRLREHTFLGMTQSLCPQCLALVPAKILERGGRVYCRKHCPMCYASSGPGGKHLTFEQCRAAIDRLVQVEGRAEVLQLSGGEPTIHPEFLRVLEYACSCAVDLVMINSNGLRFAHDPAFLE